MCQTANKLFCEMQFVMAVRHKVEALIIYHKKYQSFYLMCRTAPNFTQGSLRSKGAKNYIGLIYRPKRYNYLFHKIYVSTKMYFNTKLGKGCGFYSTSFVGHAFVGSIYYLYMVGFVFCHHLVSAYTF